MRISTAQMFSQTTTSILQKQTAAAKSLDQLSSGKKISSSGEDPVAALAIDNLTQQQALTDQFMRNIDYATNHLNMAESQLGNAGNLVTSMREQVLRAVNGTLASGERQMIADELQGSLEELLKVANTQDESGNYLFAGFQVESQPFAFDAAGAMVYQGDDGIRQAIVASNVGLGINIPGDMAFMKGPNGLGDYGVNYLASQAGDFRVLSAAVTNSTTHVPDIYTFNFIDNGAGGVNLEVRDSSSALVANVNNFNASVPVAFNGIEVQLDGKPLAGDSFSMSPQSEISIFDTVTQAISLINDDTLINSPAGKAQLAQLLNNFDSGLEQLASARAIAGNNLKSLENYTGRHEEEQVVNSSALSILQDLDYASAISEFEKQQLALNAVSNVFGKVSSTSLFDYI
ncbi:flagellar hook-associated protein FlgL [Shewanella cyperi]|uniref:flagellar hook-associated protein FlgL n=1 Tax=Shewanella cyperi TaxID=2814292 RepID=UPI001A94AA5A|nr:flagellar hook-associated protein FlgL [Shewanella cyperi]QSX39694.1 flagellar hook-associated protein FlgL [Shewanella cyperi]